MQIKLSDAIAKYLRSIGINVVFGYQGGSITHMIDSFRKYCINYVQSYNEQGAGLAADAFARVSKLGIGVAIGTNGPGATNLITAIANAYCDSVPVLFFTGQVHTFAMKKDSNVRQESFQEIDIVSMVRPITKYAVTITEKNEALNEIKIAIEIALADRMGPVLIDLPVDIQGEYIEDEQCSYEGCIKRNCHNEFNELEIKKIADAILHSDKPLFLAGGGIRSSRAVDEFRKLVKVCNIPVAVSLMGLDVLPHEDENFVGFIGTYGNRYANIAVQNADLIIAIGTRLDMRQTGKQKHKFANNAAIIHVDIDENEIEHYIKETISLKCDINVFISHLRKVFSNKTIKSYEPWKRYIRRWKEKYPSEKEFNETKEINPNKIVNNIGKLVPNHSIVTFDVGQNQMWTAQSLRMKGDDIRILNSGGLGTMGYSLPAGIGAYFAEQTRTIISNMGDGGLQMNVQELQMVAQYRIPIKVIVYKNNALGLIRDIHEKYYNRRYIGSVEGFSVPPLDKLASVYNMSYLKIDGEIPSDQLEKIFSDSNAWMIEVEMNSDTYIRPELLGTDALDKQSPYL